MRRVNEIKILSVISLTAVSTQVIARYMCKCSASVPLWWTDGIYTLRALATVNDLVCAWIQQMDFALDLSLSDNISTDSTIMMSVRHIWSKFDILKIFSLIDINNYQQCFLPVCIRQVAVRLHVIIMSSVSVWHASRWELWSGFYQKQSKVHNCHSPCANQEWVSIRTRVFCPNHIAGK